MAKQSTSVKQLDKIVREMVKVGKPAREAVDSGLYVNLSKENTLTWLYRYSFRGRRRWMGLGSYDSVNTLAKMRLEANRLKGLVREGVDPIEQRKSLKAELRPINKPTETTFEACAKALIEKKRPQWKIDRKGRCKSAKAWTNTLTDYAYPVIGNMQVQDVTLHHLEDILDPIWYTKTETASRVRGRIESVLSYAKLKGYRTGENPAVWRGNLDMVYKPKGKTRKVKHHPAMDYKELPEFMQQLKLKCKTCISAKALMLTILTVPRTSEVIYAKASEIVGDIWTIPEERMKRGIKHKIPLSIQAVELIKGLTPVDGWLFPGMKAGEPISTGTMDSLLEVMGRKDVTVHGFRATFETYMEEEQNFSENVIDTCLAHLLKDSNDGAYNRANYLEKRSHVMQIWADYCLPTEEGNVTPIRA